MNQMGSPVPCLNQRLTRIRDYLIKITSGFFKAPVVMPSPLSLNRGPEYPTSSRIGRVPRLRKIQYSRLGVSRGPYYPLSDGTRESVGYAEDSHHRTDQLAHRARLPHFHANRSSIDLAEYSNQRGRVPVQYGEISKAVQTQLGPTQQNGRDPPQHSQLEHRRHSAEQTEWRREQGQANSPLQQSEDTTLVSVEAWGGSGSARSQLPCKQSLSRKRTECMVKQWHSEKEKLAKDDLDAHKSEDVLYTLVNIYTIMIRDRRGVVGDVARAIGGPLVAPPIDPIHIQRYFGDFRGLGP